MSVILLVRHGQATFGLGTYDRLSDHGKLQAARVAEVLRERGVTVDRVRSGDQERQRDTAHAIADALGTAGGAQIDSRWNEYEHMPLIARVKPMYRKRWLMVADLARSGDPSRRLQDVIDTALLQWVEDEDGASTDHAADPSTAYETFSAYRDRIAAALDEVSQEDGTSLVVSSAGTITAAVAPLIGLPSTAWPALHRVVVNTSITKIVRGRRGLSVISFNEHGHLEGLPDVSITYR